MKKAFYRKFGVVKIAHVWFADMPSCEKALFTYVHGIDGNDANVSKECKISEQATLITDLSLDEDVLWQKIKKNTKYEIRRAEKEGVSIVYFLSKDMPRNLLKKFKTVYEEMYASKGLKRTFNADLIDAYIKNDMIIFSVAYFEDEPLVFHSYIFDDDHVRFFYSCSPFRDEREMANLIGRMNRFLHWSDFKYFKNRGVKAYDWGGIDNLDNPNSISKFKLAFGGDPIVKYNYLIAKGFLGSILLKVL